MAARWGNFFVCKEKHVLLSYQDNKEHLLSCIHKAHSSSPNKYDLFIWLLDLHLRGAFTGLLLQAFSHLHAFAHIVLFTWNAIHTPFLSECLPFSMYINIIHLWDSSVIGVLSLCASPVTLLPGECGPSDSSIPAGAPHKALVQQPAPHFSLICSDSEVREGRLNACWQTRRKINVSSVGFTTPWPY